MGQTYKVIFTHWDNWYCIDSKALLINQVKQIIPHAEIEADCSDLLVMYIDGTRPEVLKDVTLEASGIYYIGDWDQGRIIELNRGVI